MSRSPTRCALFLVLAAVLVTHEAEAQYSIRPDLIASGGGRLTGTSFSITGSAGQSAIGLLSGEYRIQAGFWFEAFHMPAAAPEVEGILPLTYALAPSFPNPSHLPTTIRFALPRTSHVSIRLFDVSGRQIGVLMDRTVEPGYHSLKLDSFGLRSGIYYCQMVAGGFKQTRRLVILD